MPTSNPLVQDDPTTYVGGTDIDEYLDWWDDVSEDITDSGDPLFAHTVFVTKDDTDSEGMAVHWTLVDNNKSIRLAVAYRAKSWVGFGIAENGGMKGADIVTFEASTGEFVDRHVLDEIITPIPDRCQNWRKTSHVVGDDFIILELFRALDTKDPQDRVIKNDGDILTPPTRIIGAWGDGAFGYHGQNRVRGAVRFFGEADVGEERDQFYRDMDEYAMGSFVLQADNYEIPARETTYARFCFRTSVIEHEMLVPLSESLHVIGIEPLLDPISGKKHVHHFGITAANFAWEGDDCSTFLEMEPVYMWAQGEPPFSLPPEAGVSIGKDGLLTFMLEIHFDNRLAESGVLDSSGVRLYYTSDKRPYDMGIFSIGDPTFHLRSDIGAGYSRHTFTCPSSCTESVADQNLTVIREFLHMHEGGQAMYNEQIRDGVVLRTASVDFFEYRQQGLFAVIQEPYQIVPGDSFRTVCQYQTDNPRRFGLGSQEEMCISSIWYYPKQVKDLFPLTCGFFEGYSLPAMEKCRIDYSSELLDNVTELGRSFGEPKKGPWCPVPPFDPEADGCFSERTFVEVEGRGRVSMKEVVIGDRVLVVDGKVDHTAATSSSSSSQSPTLVYRYETIHGFAHKTTEKSANFLRIMPFGLEVTSGHLIFVGGRGAVPASSIQVGDTLIGKPGQQVTAIERVVREGVFAPLTGSGTVVVNGVVSSCYVSLQNDSAFLTVFGWTTPWSFHSLGHLHELPHRAYCRFFGCTHETYDDDGVSSWHSPSYGLWKTLF